MAQGTKREKGISAQASQERIGELLLREHEAARVQLYQQQVLEPMAVDTTRSERQRGGKYCLHKDSEVTMQDKYGMPSPQPPTPSFPVMSQVKERLLAQGSEGHSGRREIHCKTCTCDHGLRTPQSFH